MAETNTDSKEDLWTTTLAAVAMAAYVYYLAGPGLDEMLSEPRPSDLFGWVFVPFMYFVAFVFLLVLPTAGAFQINLALRKWLGSDVVPPTPELERVRGQVNGAVLVTSALIMALLYYGGYQQHVRYWGKQETLVYVLLAGRDDVTRAKVLWYRDDGVIIESLTFVNNRRAEIEACSVGEELTGYCETPSGTIRLLGTKEVR